MMTEKCNYRCVNCGKPAAALYKIYSPTVLKLTKCESCKGIVDKYIEYDPVIVMIDLVLMSKEAQRHVLFNTDFKSFWKLLIILMMLETYGVWRNDSLFTIAVNFMCDFNNTDPTNISTTLNAGILGSWKSYCWAWEPIEKDDDSDLFIWEKDFYIQFVSIFLGLFAFLITVQILMKLVARSQNKVSVCVVLKALSLAHAAALLALPALVWGDAASPATRTRHYALAFAYGFVVFYNVVTVVYETPPHTSLLAAAAACGAQLVATFRAAPALRAALLWRAPT